MLVASAVFSDVNLMAIIITVLVLIIVGCFNVLYVVILVATADVNGVFETICIVAVAVVVVVDFVVIFDVGAVDGLFSTDVHFVVVVFIVIIPVVSVIVAVVVNVFVVIHFVAAAVVVNVVIFIVVVVNVIVVVVVVVVVIKYVAVAAVVDVVVFVLAAIYFVGVGGGTIHWFTFLSTRLFTNYFPTLVDRMKTVRQHNWLSLTLPMFHVQQFHMLRILKLCTVAIYSNIGIITAHYTFVTLPKETFQITHSCSSRTSHILVLHSFNMKSLCLQGAWMKLKTQIEVITVPVMMRKCGEIYASFSRRGIRIGFLFCLFCV